MNLSCMEKIQTNKKYLCEIKVEKEENTRTDFFLDIIYDSEFMRICKKMFKVGSHTILDSICYN